MICNALLIILLPLDSVWQLHDKRSICDSVYLQQVYGMAHLNPDII